jgi:hypothetical protein
MKYEFRNLLIIKYLRQKNCCFYQIKNKRKRLINLLRCCEHQVTLFIHFFKSSLFLMSIFHTYIFNRHDIACHIDVFAFVYHCFNAFGRDNCAIAHGFCTLV